MRPILTMERAQSCPVGAHPARPAEWALYLTWPEGMGEVPLLPATDRVAFEPVVFARLNAGRWLVECPWCPGVAQLAAESDHRFMCVDCFNVRADGKWLRVVWPADRAAIEEMVARRPVANRNWEHGETLDFLRSENVEHGTL